MKHRVEKKNVLEWSVHSLTEGDNKFHLSLKPEDIGIDTITRNKMIESDINLKRNGSEILLEGEVKFSLDLDCSRCFKQFTLNKNEKIYAYFIKRKPSVNAENKDLSEKNVKAEYYENDTINISPVLSDTINLSLPIKPLCRNDCKGLCPFCGVDLNNNQCNCKKEKMDPRWEPLKKLMKNK